jgi:hypothetical protein
VNERGVIKNREEKENEKCSARIWDREVKMNACTQKRNINTTENRNKAKTQYKMERRKTRPSTAFCVGCLSSLEDIWLVLLMRKNLQKGHGASGGRKLNT